MTTQPLPTFREFAELVKETREAQLSQRRPLGGSTTDEEFSASKRKHQLEWAVDAATDQILGETAR